MVFYELHKCKYHIKDIIFLVIIDRNKRSTYHIYISSNVFYTKILLKTRSILSNVFNSLSKLTLDTPILENFIYIYRYHIKRILSSRIIIDKNKAISLSHIQTYLIKNSTKLVFFLIFTASERDTRTTFASYSCQVDSSVLTKHQHIYPDQTNKIHWKGKNQ